MTDNNPFMPEYRRPPRGDNPEKWGGTAYRDPVGDEATANVKREGKP